MKLLEILAPQHKDVKSAWIGLVISTAFLVVGMILGASPFVIGVFAAFAYRDVIDILVAYAARKKTEVVKVTGEVL